MAIYHPVSEDYARVSGLNLNKTRPPLIQDVMSEVEIPPGWRTARFPNSVRFHQHRTTIPSVSLRMIGPNQMRVELDRRVNGRICTEHSVHTSVIGARAALLNALQLLTAA